MDATPPPLGDFAAAMATALAATGPCPNTPPCPHAGGLHDIYTPEDPRPICCAEGCGCRATPEPDPRAGAAE